MYCIHIKMLDVLVILTRTSATQANLPPAIAKASIVFNVSVCLTVSVYFPHNDQLGRTDFPHNALSPQCIVGTYRCVCLCICGPTNQKVAIIVL